MVESFTNKVNGTAVDSLSYVYDNNGNITEIKRDGEVLIQYAYDGLNQLVREDNAILGKICTYTYDTAGNITEKKVHNRTALGVGVLEQTIPYGYATSGWKDRLVSYNGQAITYDALGNPTSYRGHMLVWGKIRRLEAYDTNSFTYNAEGIRTSKNGITYELDGTKIIREVRGANVIEYYYGSSGVAGFTYNGTQYYYQKNLQGDIVTIYTASGNKVAEYVYDAWGKCTVLLDTDNMGTINPFRYRGYYFDTETGLYYLQTRYYDPEVCRFINADGKFDNGIGLLGYALFTYCGNNPITFIDSYGMDATSISSPLNKNFTWRNFSSIGDGYGGAIGAGMIIVAGFSLGTLFKKLINGISSLFKSKPASTAISVDNIDWDGGDKNHILKGTEKRHVKGWKRFGIDPNNGNDWEKLLPILQEVVEHADDVSDEVLKTGGTLIRYTKTYIELGVKVVVEIWTSSDGLIQKLSDAIPYIVD